MGVADRRQLVGDRGVAALEQGRQDRLGLVPRGRIVLRPDVADAVQLVQQLARPGRVEPVGVLGLEPAQHVEVVVQPPGARVEAGDLAAVEHHRLTAGIGARQLTEEAVAGELDAQVEPLARGRRLAQHGVHAGALGAGVQPLERPAALPQRGLAVADPQQIDALTLPALRHGRLDLEPVGGPERPERLAQLAVAVVEQLCIGRLDAIDRARRRPAARGRRRRRGSARGSGPRPGRCARACRRGGAASARHPR